MILNYKNWKKLYEQASPGSSSDPIDFIVTAGASAKPMSDKALNTNQGYPLPTDSPQLNHIYELPLSSALSGDFSKAKIIGPVNSGENDQIIFDNNSIKGQGKISIEWTRANFSKQVRVSGNGALVLARASDQTKNLQNRGTLTGVITLELSAASLYSNIWSIISSGLSSGTLRASLKGRITQVAVQTSADDLKTKMVEKWNDTLNWVETQYSPSILETVTEGGTKKPKSNYPPLPTNTSIQQYYGKYTEDSFTKGDAAQKLAPLVKKNMVDAGMDALVAYVDTYFTEKLVGLDKTEVSRMTAKAKSNIQSVKAEYTKDKIVEEIKGAVVTLPGTARNIPTSQTSVKSSEYQEGKSKK
jgi:hypothetical protein